MKKKIFITLFLSCFIVVIGLFFISNEIFHNIKNAFVKNYYLNIIKRYHTVKNRESLVLKSLAQYLATSNITIKAYLTNNKKYLINAYMPLYKAFYKNKMITEMHFFKPPAINFLAFSNINLKNINLSKSRADVALLSHFAKPAIYFYICRRYPGMRVTYPIIYHNKIYGNVVSGLNITFFKDIFDKLNMPTTIYLNDKLLKKFLIPKRYEIYKKYPLYKNYRVIGNLYKINFNKKYEFKKSSIYVIIPIKDFFKRNIGYIVIERSLRDVLDIGKYTIFTVIIFSIIIFIGVFSIFFVLFEYIYKRFHELEKILLLIKNKNFNNLKEPINQKDEFDKFQSNLIDVAKDLSVYINLLSDERSYFLNKAYKDELTSVYNRNFLEEKKEEIESEVRISKEPLGVILFDIDNFKQINDKYGHDVGDLVLKEVAKAIKNILRKSDFIIRYGGEEFLILLHNTSFENTIKIAQKIRKTIENLEIPTSFGKLKVTVSVGVSEFLPEDKSLFEAIKKADINLYKAKNSGKNRVVY